MDSSTGTLVCGLNYHIQSGFARRALLFPFWSRAHRTVPLTIICRSWQCFGLVVNLSRTICSPFSPTCAVQCASRDSRVYKVSLRKRAIRSSPLTLPSRLLSPIARATRTVTCLSRLRRSQQSSSRAQRSKQTATLRRQPLRPNVRPTLRLLETRELMERNQQRRWEHWGLSLGPR